MTNICVYGAASNEIDKEYIVAAEELGSALAKNGFGVVYGGGKDGVMGATARGVLKEKGYVLGVAPTFFEERDALMDGLSDFVYTKTMRERKQTMEDNADGFIVAPGGIGTFEEFFEILTSKQLSLHTKPIVVFNVLGYYDKIIDLLDFAIEKEFVKEECKKLLYVTDSIDDIINYLKNYSDDNIKGKIFKTGA